MKIFPAIDIKDKKCVRLIKELKVISSRNDWNLMRWITRDDNTTAKSLYEKLSKKTNWEVYELS